jgi:hypothetical protein
VNTAKRRQRAHAALEYLIATTVLTTVLFVGSPSLASTLVQAVRIAYARYLFSLGLP